MRTRSLCVVLALVLVSLPLFAGTVGVRSANYINFPGTTFTETFTMTYQVFTGSTNCSSGGGPVVTLSHVDSVTGISFPITAADSFQLSLVGGTYYINGQSEQNGPFVGWRAADPGNLIPLNTVDGRTVCSAGFNDTRDYYALFYAGLETLDACGAPKSTFAPGETMQVKVSGGLIFEPEQLRFFIAGGSPNECTLVPSSSVVHVDTDPWYATFTIPATDADLPSYCAPNGTQHVTGLWRTLVYDSSCGCNRAQTNFTVADDAPPSSCAITCPSDIAVSNEAGLCGAHVTFTPPAGPGTVTCDHSSGAFFPVGTTAVNCSSSLGTSCSFNVTVSDIEAPAITAPPDVTAECDAPVSLGSASASDNCPGVTVSNDAPGSFPLGTTTVTWTATDAHGHSATDTQTVTVADTTPPSITAVVASSTSLWPPNHNMVDVTVSYGATDTCGSTDCALSMTSNEPANGLGDGDAAPDWEIVDAHHIRLRAERAGTGSGRIYTITATCSDGNGNTATQSTTVTVPHSK
jgi:hypothetical protein